MSVEQHVIYSLHNATKHQWPFPHFFVEDVFPADFYAEIQEFLRKKQDFHESGFANRTFTDENRIPGLDFMAGKAFLGHILDYFRDEVRAMPQYQMVGNKMQVTRDLRLIRDQQNYKIGPHTDAPHKMVSLLFYLPDISRYAKYGTSIFVPIDPTFTCDGGPHYPFEPFEKVWTAPFLPNSCFGFWKTSNSFHGVEPIPVSFQRDVLLYNIYRQKAQDGP